MWTCGKDYYPYIKGAGYTEIRKLTKEEKRLPKREYDRLRTRNSCFIAVNARATNDFRDRSVLAYCHNMFLNPYIVKFFARKGIEFDENTFALSCLIQWIWRSCIRDRKPIKLYIPALRMRTLFGDWLCRDKNNDT